MKHVGFLILALVGLSACAIDPVTGRSTLMLMSERQEIALGEQNDAASLEHFGVYADADIQHWVEEVGLPMAAAAERPHLPWTFRVLDDAAVNAFAGGGGYVYLTRGILAWANSEAEIVGVLGHEIGHVTARHIAERYTSATLAQVGFAAGMVLSPELRSVGGELQTGLGLLMLKFSRDNESESDRLGVRYAVRAGYDARELAGFFTTLDRLAGPAQDRLPSWASTHPAPAGRAAEVMRAAESLVAAGQLRVGREAHLARIDGLVFGDDPREGVLEGRSFKHPELLFQVEFPADWQVQNGKTVVVAAPRDGSALVALTATERQGESLREHANAALQARGATNIRGGRTTVAGLPAYWAAYNASDDGVILGVRETYVEYRGLVYDLIGYARDRDYARYAASFEDYGGSFREWSRREADLYQPDRIRIVHTPRAGRFDTFVTAGPAADVERLALLNGLEPGTKVASGFPLKTVVAGYPRRPER